MTGRARMKRLAGWGSPKGSRSGARSWPRSATSRSSGSRSRRGHRPRDRPLPLGLRGDQARYPAHAQQRRQAVRAGAGGDLRRPPAPARDRTYIDDIERRIQRDRINVEWAVHESTVALAKRFAKIDDEYLRETRAGPGGRVAPAPAHPAGHRTPRDLRGPWRGDPGRRRPGALRGDSSRAGQRGGIRRRVRGRTSHTSIIARSLGIPTVSGVVGVTGMVTDEDPIVVDGGRGVVVLHPTEQVLEEYRSERSAADRRRGDPPSSAVTAGPDPRRRRARADGEHRPARGAVAVRAQRARGIGLYRSEFLYMETDPHLPTEEDHHRIYRRLIDAAHPFRRTSGPTTWVDASSRAR